MIIATATPYVIEQDRNTGERELVVRVRLSEDGAWSGTRWLRFPDESTYDDIVSSIWGSFDVDEINVQLVLMVETVMVNRHWSL